MENFTERKAPAGLYDPRFEHDNCGIGAVVDIKGRKSHKTIDDALQIVEHLEHRAGKDAEGKTGDGVGILTQISDTFFQKAAAELGITLGSDREYGVGMFFFPQEELRRNQAKKLFEIVCKKEGLPFLGWREVPTDPEVLGHKARACMPSIWQGFVVPTLLRLDLQKPVLDGRVCNQPHFLCHRKNSAKKPPDSFDRGFIIVFLVAVLRSMSHMIVELLDGSQRDLIQRHMPHKGKNVSFQAVLIIDLRCGFQPGDKRRAIGFVHKLL